MVWDTGAAIEAGLVATAVMTALLYMGIALMPRQMTMNLLYMLGTMMAPNSRGAVPYVIGAMIHTVNGIGLGLAHAGVIKGFDLDSNLAAWGLLFGFVHYLVVGMAMGMVGMMHPLMRRGEMQAPGLFVKNHPTMTIMGFLMLHLVFGVVVAVLYDAWA